MALLPISVDVAACAAGHVSEVFGGLGRHLGGNGGNGINDWNRNAYYGRTYCPFYEYIENKYENRRDRMLGLERVHFNRKITPGPPLPGFEITCVGSLEWSVSSVVPGGEAESRGVKTGWIVKAIYGQRDHVEGRSFNKRLRYAHEVFGGVRQKRSSVKEVINGILEKSSCTIIFETRSTPSQLQQVSNCGSTPQQVKTEVARILANPEIKNANASMSLTAINAKIEPGMNPEIWKQIQALQPSASAQRSAEPPEAIAASSTTDPSSDKARNIELTPVSAAANPVGIADAFLQLQQHRPLNI